MTASSNAAISSLFEEVKGLLPDLIIVSAEDARDRPLNGAMGS